uniref:THH1/TOM1/TOM3 domain-containing protein n=1 Tax=Timspurckia oligopyrenoides TaxID=708627 RepID=A0A7S0ZD15_9RHOD|mmetsp:Transcript_13018/g.23410  ORF Transcript_13018/g.23410 Transcript_13018/m.23410 type:complete len:354 (+) Transcript_13018:154-1215(+)
MKLLKLLVYVLFFALFINISYAQLKFHPPRPDRPDNVFGGKFVFLTVQTNFIITAYLGLCVLELTITHYRVRTVLERAVHVVSGAVFSVGFMMGAGYYALVHFDERTRAQAATIEEFDYYMHLLHAPAACLLLFDILFKDKTFQQSAPETLVEALNSLSEMTSMYSSASLNKVTDNPNSGKEEAAEPSGVQGVKVSLIKKPSLRKVRRSAARMRRALIVRLHQGDTIAAMLYGVFYLCWSVLCARMNNGWWPYPFQQNLRWSQLAMLYAVFITLILPSLTITSRALRGRGTQVTQSMIRRSSVLLRRTRLLKRTNSRGSFADSESSRVLLSAPRRRFSMSRTQSNRLSMVQNF